MTAGRCLLFRGEQRHTHNLLQVPIAELAERWTELSRVLDESRSFFRVHTGYFSNIPKCIKAEFIASWGCSQSSVVSSSKQYLKLLRFNVLQRALNPPGTTLNAFFTLCQEDAFARTLLYSEVPSYYTWNETKNVFIRHRRGEPVDGQPGIYREITIGRLYTVHPNQD
ncbi:uncharacterized protein TNCV_2017731 [Trichonephila clavipes]|nr:uncharacterized protein TNCV_2017731 [Trichonephila clavipes]